MENSAARGTDGRFRGAPRVNVESCPRLPTFPARWMLSDPRGRPYFVFWISPDDGSLSLGLRMESIQEGKAVQISTPDGWQFPIKIVRRSLPARGGTDILYRCPWCGRPRRYLYPLTLVGRKLVIYQGPRCQLCSGLRWASQGSYRSVVARAFAAGFGARPGAKVPYPRHPWNPRAVSDPRTVVAEFPNELGVRSEAQEAGRPS